VTCRETEVLRPVWRTMRPLVIRILMAIVALCAGATLGRAGVASIECQANNGTSFRVDIDADALRVIRHGYDAEIFKNGSKVTDPTYPRDCNQYLSVSESSYSWGISCPSSGGVVYSEQIDRYTGTWTGRAGMFTRGPANCFQVPRGQRF
jgi:hypothetical protein